MEKTITSFLVLFFLIVIYFVPTIVANQNKHHNKSAIATLNFFLGWTLLGWVIALIWANTKKPDSK